MGYVYTHWICLIFFRDILFHQIFVVEQCVVGVIFRLFFCHPLGNFRALWSNLVSSGENHIAGTFLRNDRQKYKAIFLKSIYKFFNLIQVKKEGEKH